MTKVETLEQVRLVCRMRRLSRHTEDTYAGWIARFVDYVRKIVAFEQPEAGRLRSREANARAPFTRVA